MCINCSKITSTCQTGESEGCGNFKVEAGSLQILTVFSCMIFVSMVQQQIIEHTIDFSLNFQLSISTSNV